MITLVPGGIQIVTLDAEKEMPKANAKLDGKTLPYDRDKDDLLVIRNIPSDYPYCLTTSGPDTLVMTPESEETRALMGATLKKARTREVPVVK